MMTENRQSRSPENLKQFRRSKSNRSPVLQHHLNRRLNNRVDVDEDAAKRLDVVDLSGMSLDSLPNPSLNLAAICKLDLSNNNLESIPESLVARLLNVVVFDLHSNQLISLPNSIGCLSKLKVLNVSANLLHAIPKPIENCRSLEELNANFNNLTSLPETIGFELTNLKKLSVNSNKITFLPYSTSHLTALRVLDVRLNCLRSLPDDLENLINLETLNVSQNFHHLSALPYSTGLLLSLLDLDVSYNNLVSLPPSLCCLQKLKRLSVEGNPLTSPPMEVVEVGLQAVREYLTNKMNDVGSEGKRKTTSSSWFGRLRKYKTMNARMTMSSPARGVHDGGLKDFGKTTIEAIASPRHYLSMLSPCRLFSSSPRRSFSRLS
ncbi:hypothetical protein V2J09_021453 [Rumex salicifolius]